MKTLDQKTLENTNGGWFDISLIGILEEFVEVDLNGNGITGIGCLIC